MSVRISAVFDTADAADLALMHLRQRGIRVSDVRESVPHSQDPLVGPALIYPAASQLHEGGPQIAPIYTLNADEALIDGVPRDARSDSVVLEFTADQHVSDTAVGVLISSHGRQIKKYLS